MLLVSTTTSIIGDGSSGKYMYRRDAHTKGGLIATAGGEITRKKKEKTKDSRQRMALGSNKSCQGPFHRIYALAPCTMIFLGVDKNLRVCSPYALRLALYALQYAPRECFPGSALILTAAHCFESVGRMSYCCSMKQLMSKLKPVSMYETLARPEIDNCGMSKPTATVFDAGQGVVPLRPQKDSYPQKDSVCCYKVAVFCCDPVNGRKRDSFGFQEGQFHARKGPWGPLGKEWFIRRNASLEPN
jgi:hypothetical protein